MKLNIMKWKEKPDTEYSKDGLIRLNSNKPEFGSLMLATIITTINNNYLNKRVRVGFVTGRVEEIEDLILQNKLVEGSDFSAMIAPHRIVVLEKLASKVGNELGYNEKINPKTGEVLSQKGDVIVRKTMVVEEGSDIVDVMISHDSIPINDEAKNEFNRKNIVAEL